MTIDLSSSSIACEWASFIAWGQRQPFFRREFLADTGVDVSTDLSDATRNKFIDWLTDKAWGGEDHSSGPAASLTAGVSPLLTSTEAKADSSLISAADAAS